MKIVYFIDHLAPDGAQNLLRQLVEGLAARGHDQTIICLNDSWDQVLVDHLREAGANVYIVTQFTFTAGPVIAWENANRRDMDRLPVVAGLPGLATAKTLLKYALDCGVGPSLQAFSKRYSSLTKLLRISRPDRMIVDLARHKERVPESNLAGIHFFTFGGFKKTADWANKIVSGDFELTEDGGLKVS